MTQPPQASPPPDSQDPRRTDGAGTSPSAPHSGEQGGDSGSRKGPIPAIVAGGLLLLVLLLALGAYFGVRALVGDDERADQTSTSREVRPVKEGEKLGEGPAERELTEETLGADEPA